MTSASLSRGRDHRQLVLLTFLTKILSLLFPARKAPQSILSLLKFWRLIQETVRQGNEIKAKIILSTVAECTPSPPAQLTWQQRITHTGTNHHHHVPALGCQALCHLPICSVWGRSLHTASRTWPSPSLSAFPPLPSLCFTISLNSPLYTVVQQEEGQR